MVGETVPEQFDLDLAVEVAAVERYNRGIALAVEQGRQRHPRAVRAAPRRRGEPRRLAREPDRADPPGRGRELPRHPDPRLTAARTPVRPIDRRSDGRRHSAMPRPTRPIPDVRTPPLGHLHRARRRRRLQGQAHHRRPRPAPQLPEPRPPGRALGRSSPARPRVTLDGAEIDLGAGQADRHPPAAPPTGWPTTGTDELVFVEVQLGDYFGEDDIVRYSDDYGRASD